MACVESEATLGSQSCKELSWGQDLKVRYILVTLNAFLICFPLHFPLHFILDYTTRISRSVLGRYLGRIDPRFHISRDLSVESGLEVEVGPGSVQGSNPASTRPGSITGHR